MSLDNFGTERPCNCSRIIRTIVSDNEYAVIRPKLLLDVLKCWQLSGALVVSWYDDRNTRPGSAVGVRTKASIASRARYRRNHLS